MPFDIDYCLNKKTGKHVKIGSVKFNQLIQAKLKKKGKIIYKEHIELIDYITMKPTLPKISESYFYSYNNANKTIEVRRKNFSTFDLINLISKNIPSIHAQYVIFLNEYPDLKPEQVTQFITGLICSELISCD